MKNDTQKKKTYFLVYILAVITVFIFGMIMIGPKGFRDWNVQRMERAGTVFPTLSATAVPTELPERFSEVPRDYFENETETDTLIIGGAFLVVIVLLGVLISKRNNEK